MYLVCLSCKDYPTHHIQATFRLSLVNQLDPKRTHSNRLENMFSNEDSNWGDPRFFSIAKLTNESLGFLVDDSIVVEAQVSIHQNKKAVVLEDVMDAVCLQLDQLQLLLRAPDGPAKDPQAALQRAQLLDTYTNTLISLSNAVGPPGGAQPPQVKPNSGTRQAVDPSKGQRSVVQQPLF